MQKIKIYNTLKRSVEEIEPEIDDEIRIYSCGLTVYDYAHIGNLRKYIFDDLLVRVAKYFGYKIKHVQNITDVGHLTSDRDEGEDKIEKGAKREHKSAFEIARFYEEEFIKDLDRLNVLRPDFMPRATENIAEQIDLIKRLEEKSYTYKTTDGIYFDSSKLSDYGKLAGLNLEGQKEGARVERNVEKKNPSDFALWKFSPEYMKSFDSAQDGASHRQMEWPSPWGIGFPGWHIECSAMSVKYLGQPFEIHTGGVDHISVHHTNEIAQSEAAYGKPLAKYFVHSEHLLENGHKMAKSDGHFMRLKDLEEREFNPLDFRYLCLSAHYRSKLNFTWEGLKAAKAARARLKQFTLYINEEEAEDQKEFFDKALKDFDEALADDLNSPKALAVIFDTIGAAQEKKFFSRSATEFIKKIETVLELDLFTKIKEKDGVRAEVETSDEIFELAIERRKARDDKNFKESDRLRDEIEKRSYLVEDFSDHTLIKKK